MNWIYFCMCNSKHMFCQKTEETVGVNVAVRELEDVLIRDVGNKIAEDGR